jgi:hypothetical protein
MNHTFITWLRAQRKRDDAIGDLAREAMADKCLRGCYTPRSFRSHLLNEHAPSTLALAALDLAELVWAEDGWRQPLPDLRYKQGMGPRLRLPRKR